MLAVGERERRVVRVELMQCRDVDDVDVGLRAQSLDSVERWSAEVPRELVACGLERIRPRDESHPRIRREGRQHQRERTSEPGHTDADRSGHCSPSNLDMDRKSRYVGARY